MSILKIAKVRGKLPNGSVKDRRLYNRWCLMRRRCYDRSFISYAEYGARGITVCDEWRTDYLKFQSWAFANGWRSGLTIDRIDGTKGYSPDNCRWVTPTEQSENRSIKVTATINGVTKNLSVWTRELHLDRKTVYERVRRLGWTPERAVTTPIARMSIGAVEVDGVSMTVYAWAKKLKVERSWLYNQINHGGRTAEQVIRKALHR